MDILKKLFATRLAMFTVIFTALITFSFFRNITVFPFDAYYYWYTADPVFGNQFNILNFPETFRGYLFPVLLGMIKSIAIGLGISDYWGWRFLISAMIAGMLVYVFPIIFPKNYNTRIGWTSYLTNAIFILIFNIFWGDFIQYPLSDLPACFFILTGIAVLVWVKDKPNPIHKIVGGIIAGALLYATYNTRTAFLYGILIAVIVFTIYILKEKSNKNFFVLISLIIGVLLVAAPQMMINHQYVGSWIPKIYTEQWYPKGLQTQQIIWGLEFPRYETYIGDPVDYPTAGVWFDDPIGKRILEIEEITGEEFSYATIVKLFLKHPSDIGGLYIRHLVSLMTPIFSQVYITDMFAGKGVYISIAILIWMIAAIDILLDFKKKFDNMTLFMLFAMVFPSLLQLAGAPELRFFLMIYLLLYYYVTNIIDYRKLFQSIKRNWIPIIIVCTIIYFLWISNIGMLLSYNREKVLIINDNHYECISEIR